MICYLTTARYPYTINAHLASWGAPLARMVRPLTYARAPLSRRLPRAVYIRTDRDRLSPRETTLVESMTRALLDAGCPVLNHPTRSLERYELLRTLHDRGLNRFDLIRTAAALDAILRCLDARGEDRGRYILDAFCDTSDAQDLYRKHSAFRVGDTIAPRYIVDGQRWLGREPAYVDATANPATRRQVSRVAGTLARRVLHHALALTGQLHRELDLEKKRRRRGRPWPP